MQYFIREFIVCLTSPLRSERICITTVWQSKMQTEVAELPFCLLFSLIFGYVTIIFRASSGESMFANREKKTENFVM